MASRKEGCTRRTIVRKVESWGRPAWGWEMPLRRADRTIQHFSHAIAAERSFIPRPWKNLTLKTGCFSTVGEAISGIFRIAPHACPVLESLSDGFTHIDPLRQLSQWIIPPIPPIHERSLCRGSVYLHLLLGF